MPIVTQSFQKRGGIMDMWLILLLLTAMAGIMGWGMTAFVNAVLWFCDWSDGTPINWGMDLGLTLAVPFAWIFALVEIACVYWK
ncbi:MAG: hypothetical protein U0103_16165 [Candidatus Obscuribacterales bacterium]|nr:hypothetical protein [Cyanobacteria bacterium SZAS LIN-5]RTL42499.1 MAG: hypothetical protein EKK48_10945 [Candidatus Melainabacteria bacterium]